MLILDEVTGSHFVGAAGNVGTRWPIHATSTGKVLLAFDEQYVGVIDDTLEALTKRTITDRTVLEAELAEIRRRGYAETVDELEHGFSGVGAVVRGSMGDVLGALSICGPTQRLSEPRRSQLGMILMDAAERLQPR